MSNLSSAKKALNNPLVPLLESAWAGKPITIPTIYRKSGGTIRRRGSAREIKDLFYLDEMIKDMHSSGVRLDGREKWQIFLRDWYSDLHISVGMSDRVMRNHILKHFGHNLSSGFLTARERKLFLKLKL